MIRTFAWLRTTETDGRLSHDHRLDRYCRVQLDEEARSRDVPDQEGQPVVLWYEGVYCVDSRTTPIPSVTGTAVIVQTIRCCRCYNMDRRCRLKVIRPAVDNTS